MNFPNYKLGCKRSVFDRRTLMLSKYLPSVELSPPPAEADFTEKVTKPWGMMLNDQLGCCVIAAMGHIEMTLTFNADNPFVPSDRSIMVAYEDVGKYSPFEPDSDQGCDPLTALNYWRNTGIAGRKCDGFAQLSSHNQDRIRQSIAIFESSDIALMLPNAAKKFEDGQPWDIPAGQALDGDWEPYSWGGHMVMSPRYDATYCYIVTWGKLVPVTWRFMMTYCDAVFAVWSKDMLNKLGRSASGLDVATLAADLAAIDA
jgi:hypothetical protein